MVYKLLYDGFLYWCIKLPRDGSAYVAREHKNRVLAKNRGMQFAE